MKEIYLKELREGVKLVLIGLIVFGWLLAQGYKSSQMAVLDITAYNSGFWEPLQPLLSNSLLMETGVFCAIFGAVLGWMQIFTERHRDLWAFLIHRPISRDRIFAAKVLAGTSLYALAVGLPLAWLVGMVATPGHVAAPFEWDMVFPAAALFGCGLVFYFAGILTGLRQARWYASRGLGLGAAISVTWLVTFLMQQSAKNWQSSALILAGLLMIGAAAWGSFRTGGYYEGQAWGGRLALTLTMAAGMVMVLLAVITILVSVFGPPGGYFVSAYEISRSGTIYQMVINSPNRTREYFNLDGTALISAKTGKKMESKEFDEQQVGGWEVMADAGEWMNGGPAEPMRYFTLWRVADRKLWYVNRWGQLLGYDAVTHQFLGSLQPDAVSRDGATADAGAQGISTRDNRFIYPRPWYSGYYYQYDNPWSPSRTLASGRVLYEVDMDGRKLRPIFTVTNDDRILATTDVSNNTMVVTKQFIQLVGNKDQLAWRMPFEPGEPDYALVCLYPQDGSLGQYAVWIKPSHLTENQKLPSYVTWINNGGGISTPLQGRSMELPALERRERQDLTREVAVNLAPPWDLLDPHKHFDSLKFAVRMIPELLCAGMGWWLGRRYHFSTGAKWGWGLFLLATGIPGLLTFLCVQEWPAREVCAKCRRLRMVDREQCEHCGAAFAPPERNGTEIFEPLEV